MNISLTMEASYFNEKVAEWEPLIEPVAKEHSQRPMGLDISVSFSLIGLISMLFTYFVVNLRSGYCYFNLMRNCLT